MRNLLLTVLLMLGSATAFPQSNLPLDQAARDGNLLEVKRLIATGVDPNERNKWGFSALTGACTRNADSPTHTEIVRYLLAHGADVNMRVVDGTTALNEAAYWGHHDTVVVLLNAKADVNAAKDNGFTPVVSAAGQGHAQIVKLLITAGANLNRQTRNGNTALHVASAAEHKGIVKMLLAAGARPDLTNNSGASYRDVAGMLKK